MHRGRYALALLLLTGLFLLSAGPGYTHPFRIDQTSLHPGDFAVMELDTVPDLPITPTSYDVHLAFDFETTSFEGEVTMMLWNTPPGQVQPTVTLDAASSTLEIESVVVQGDGDVLDFTHTNDELTITLPNSNWDGIALTITYTGEAGTVQGPFGGMGLWMNANTMRAHTFFFPDGAHAVFPVLDDPACKASIRWTLDVPGEVMAIANGSLDTTIVNEDHTRYVWDDHNPVCTSEMGFVIGDYAVIEAQTEPFPIRFYAYPEDSTAAAHDLARVPEAIEVFEEAFGYDYPFSELKIVECGVFNGNGGQEHQTMVSLGHNMITGNRTYESIIVHEVAHQWFADLLTPIDWDHFWLNEGYAVFAEALWAEHLGDFNDYLAFIHSDRQEYVNWEYAGHDQALVNSEYDETMNSPLPYERGSVTHHMLRMKYGMDTFTDVTSAYLSFFWDEHVCSEDLRYTWIEMTGDEALTDWFDEWVWRGELPLLEYAVNDAGDELYITQVMNDYASPSHGQLYNTLELYYGDETTQQTMAWPDGEATVTWTLDPGAIPENPHLMPRDEMLARVNHRDDLTAPDLRVRVELVNENDRPDHVLQPGETATLQVFIRNEGLPLSDASWSLTQHDDRCTFPENSGDLADIAFLQPESMLLELEVTGAASDPMYARSHLTLTDGDYSTQFYFRLSTGHPEVLLIQEGCEDAIDTLSQVLETHGIVWGTPMVELNDLPQDMYNAQAVMVEVDGRYTEYLFTPSDTALRNWATTYGNISISGQYVDQAYADANPAWLGGIAGEWFGELSGPAFIGMEGDEIADGRVVMTYNQPGITQCSACCGGPNHFTTPDGYPVGAHGEYIGRVAGYGFSLHELHNSSPATMTRDELILRTALYLLGRDTAVDDEPGNGLPTEFSAEVYPVPFNSRFNVQVQLPQAGDVEVSVFNLLGREVTSFSRNGLTAGRHLLTCDAHHLASGVFFVRVQQGAQTVVVKTQHVK